MKQLLVMIIACCTLNTAVAQKKISVDDGKDLLKLLPNKIAGVDDKKELDANGDKDKVKDAKGFIGVTVYRDYGNDRQNIRLTLINESPSLISVNNYLDSPTLLKYLNNSITIVDGFPGVLQNIIREDGKVDYEILIPLTATLFSIKSTGYSQSQLLVIANTLPIDKIAKKLAK